MALKDIDRTPTSGMVAEAKKGLEWRKEFGRGGTAVGVARARDIINGDLSLSSIKRMFSFFSRHEVDKKAEGFRQGEEGYPSAGRIAWALWGGDAGFSWSKKKVAQIKKEEENRAITNAVKKGLQKKSDDHNEKVGKKNLSWNAKVTPAKLGKVFNRGIGAYKTNPGSVRPSVKSPEQWAYARVNSFLYAMEKGKFRSGKHDTDLLPSNHPVKKSMKEEKNYIMDKKEIRLYKADYKVTKDDEKEEKRVSGYAALFETDSRDLGFIETISRDAFEDRLEDNVILTFNHDPNLMLDRNIGGSLKLSTDERGLRYDAVLPNTTTANDVAELMSRGLLYESSFAFTVEDDSWSQDGDITRRTINKIGRLVDVSIVGVGAYANTDVALRSKQEFEESLNTSEEVVSEPTEEQQDIIVEDNSTDEVGSKINLLNNELKLKRRI